MITTAVMNRKLHRIISRHITPFTYHIMVTLSKRLSNGLPNESSSGTLNCRSLNRIRSCSTVPSPHRRGAPTLSTSTSNNRFPPCCSDLHAPIKHTSSWLLVMSSLPWLADHSVMSSKINLTPNYKFVLVFSEVRIL